MEFNLSGKTVLITGSTDGLGKALALRLASRGAELILHGRNEKKLTSLSDEISKISNTKSINTILCDLNSIDDIFGKFTTIKSLDIVINNAGLWLEGNTIEATPERIIELNNINLLAPMLITRALIPVLQKSNFGQIINISSVAGVEIPSGYFHTIYSATKIGLQGFTEALVKEFENTNIRVMGFYPGGMETDLFKKAGENYEKHEPWMFDVNESVDAIEFMLTRSTKVNLKRLDLFNHLQK